MLFDHTTRTLFCGDLFSQYGRYAPTTTDDIVGPAIEAEDGVRVDVAPPRERLDHSRASPSSTSRRSP